MRMRLKKHLEERIAECNGVLIAREGDFYTLTETQKATLCVDVKDVFQRNAPIVLEIGCGKGAWAIEMAKRHPETDFLAVEKLSNVIVAACENAQNATNLRFMNVRAENLGWWLPHDCIDVIALNFSCPFPKKTYANRRLTSENFLRIYRELLTDDGYITQKTDDRDFFEWSIESYAQNGFATYDIDYDLPDSPENVTTEYEAKFRAMHKPIYALKAKPQK